MKRIVIQRAIYTAADSAVRTIIHRYNATACTTADATLAALTVSHAHDGHQLSLLLGGQVRVMVDDVAFTMREGDLFFLAAGLPHAIVDFKGEPEAIVVQFKPDLIPDAASSLPDFAFVEQLLRKGVGGLVFHCVQLAMLESITCAVGIHRVSALFNLLDYLGRNLTDATQLSQRASVGVDTHTVSARANQYLLSHYREQVVLKQVADCCHLQEAALCRAYKRETGVTIFHQLQLIRLEMACSLLRGTTQSIAEVAYNCGFSTPSGLNRLFAKIIGVTPTDYRKLK